MSIEEEHPVVRRRSRAMLNHDQRRADHGGGTGTRTHQEPSIGKSPLVPDLHDGEPVATEASGRGDQKKKLLDDFHKLVKKEKDRVVAQLDKKIVGKLAGAPEKAVEKALDQLESKAENAISHGLAEGAKNCLEQADANDISQAIGSARLIAAYHMLKDVDAAIEREIKSVTSKEPAALKTLKFVINLGAVAAALIKYGVELETANNQLQRLMKLVERCRDRPKVSAKPLPAPNVSPKTLPETIPVPADGGIGPTEQIHVPLPLVSGVA